jgi:hypothetical protein
MVLRLARLLLEIGFLSQRLLPSVPGGSRSTLSAPFGSLVTTHRRN